MPVNKVANGVGSAAEPMAFSFCVSLVARIVSPSLILPDPSCASPSKGTASPTINRPTPLIVSETATALSPPNTAYIEPIAPISTMVKTSAGNCPTPSNCGTSNNCRTVIEPE